LYGENDEIYSIIKEQLGQINIKYIYIKDILELGKIEEPYIIYVWNVEDEKTIKHLRYINFIKEL
jgi:hypothetical protein